MTRVMVWLEREDEPDVTVTVETEDTAYGVLLQAAVKALDVVDADGVVTYDYADTSTPPAAPLTDATGRPRTGTWLSDADPDTVDANATIGDRYRGCVLTEDGWTRDLETFDLAKHITPPPPPNPGRPQSSSRWALRRPR